MSFPASLARWLRLPRARRQEFGVALAALLCVQLGLALMGFARVRRIADTVKVPARPIDDERSVASAAARAVATAARHCPTRPNCLAIALALQWILGVRGIRTHLHVGVRKVHGTLDAHAWLERCGEPLIDSRDVGDRFAVLTAARL